MQLSPESKSVLDKLSAGDVTTAGNIMIGPLDEITRLSLQVVIDNYEQLSHARGHNQVEVFLKAYRSALETKAEKTPANSRDANVKSQHSTAIENQTRSPQNSTVSGTCFRNVSTPSYWRLHGLECKSIRGVAPCGEVFSFEFDGKSNLLFGPNGSGKSSLLGAVIWVLTGQALTDAIDPKDVASIHRISQDTAKGSKICDWPVVSTLPDTEDPGSVIPSSTAQIELKSLDESTTIYLRRTAPDKLEVSTDRSKWELCADLSAYGIKSLDLQLSLIAPTVFGRQAIENAPDARSILSLMLGYDHLENLGMLVSNLARNRTIRTKALKESIASQWEKLKAKLTPLPDTISDENQLKTLVEALAKKAHPSSEEIEAIENETSKSIIAFNRSLAEILGIEQPDTSKLEQLGEKLITSIANLEKDFSDVFPLLSSVQLQSIFPDREELSTEDQLNQLQAQLEFFSTRSQNKIAERLKWWRKETEPGSKASLLLRAAQDYDLAKMECPVCELPIKDLPLRGQLESLKKMDTELLQKLKDFFRNLSDELDKLVPEGLSAIAKSLPDERVLSDWEQLKNDKIAPELTSLVTDFENQVCEIAEKSKMIEAKIPEFLPENAEPEFSESAKNFVQSVERLYTALAILCWSSRHFDPVKQELRDIITAPPAEKSSSLLAIFSKGKTAALEIKPLKTIRSQLKEISEVREAIGELENELELLEDLKDRFDELKKLSNYADSKTTEIFYEIKEKATDNWNLLYPESSTGLSPSRLVMGRSKSVEALLSQGNYEVPGQFFANAGLQRAIALSFLCALLDKHPCGLGFVILDDPILSLDDEHRERWSRKILKPRMQTMQVILATHQRQYLNNCKCDFAAGQIVELNHRCHKSRISCRPGHRLDRAEKEINFAWTNAPNELRKYREELFYSLNSYSPEPFFDSKNFSDSLKRYVSFQEPHPLASKARNRIMTILQNSAVERVLDPGSHHITEADITKPMVSDCLDLLRQCDIVLKNELERLEGLREHALRGSAIPVALTPFISIPVSWDEPLELQNIGRAAAKPDSWAVDITEEICPIKVPPAAAVLVTGDTLDPVARCGQWVLLAREDIQPKDGDLVAATSSNGDRYLRRMWFDDKTLILQAINPVKPAPIICAPKVESPMRKVIGVLYEPLKQPDIKSSSKTLEWQLRSDFKVQTITNLKTILVEGNSLDPIARKGQKVLVAKPQSPQTATIEQGGLAALEITDEAIGNVIKRIYRQGEHWTLVSANPVEPHTPDVVPISKIKQLWPLCGVLFETIED